MSFVKPSFKTLVLLFVGGGMFLLAWVFPFFWSVKLSPLLFFVPSVDYKNLFDYCKIK